MINMSEVFDQSVCYSVNLTRAREVKQKTTTAAQAEQKTAMVDQAELKQTAQKV